MCQSLSRGWALEMCQSLSRGWALESPPYSFQGGTRVDRCARASREDGLCMDDVPEPPARMGFALTMCQSLSRGWALEKKKRPGCEDPGTPRRVWAGCRSLAVQSYVRLSAFLSNGRTGPGNVHPAAVFAAVSERSWLIIELTKAGR